MTQPIDFWKAVESIRDRDSRYEPAAYGFVMESLEHTMHQVRQRRHVRAAELLNGMVEFARDRYGVMAFTVLQKWGVTETGHIGELVFNLVAEGVLSKEDEDNREDFDDAFDLYEVLEQGYFDRDVRTP